MIHVNVETILVHPLTINTFIAKMTSLSYPTCFFNDEKEIQVKVVTELDAKIVKTIAEHFDLIIADAEVHTETSVKSFEFS